jgi:hypothetical protein
MFPTPFANKPFEVWPPLRQPIFLDRSIYSLVPLRVPPSHYYINAIVIRDYFLDLRDVHAQLARYTAESSPCIDANYSQYPSD